MSRLHQKLYDQVFEAILTGNIAPGTRLAEIELAELYNVSRSVIRRTLQRMSDEGLVDIRQNRGASVCNVDALTASQIFEARAVIELGIVDLICGNLSASRVTALRQICVAESQAMAADNRARGLRLAAEFHLQLAEATENPVLTQYASNLMSRSALAIACLERESPVYCAYGEHEAIIDALVENDLKLGRQLMSRHIDHIASNLDLATESEPVPLAKMLQG
jgi:DNA-binding GntR family transcriptional regulator